MDILKYVISGICTVVGHLFHGEGEKFLSVFNRHKHVQSSAVEKEPTERRGSFNVSSKKVFLICCGIIFCCSIICSLIFFQTPKVAVLPEDVENPYLWYLEQMQDNETPELLNGLGECYFYGHGVEVNYENAVKCFKQAAEAGNNSAKYNLGVCYSNGYGLELDDEQALKYFMSAEKKFADAKAYVGYYTYCGWGGLEVDKDSGLKLLKTAQKQGSVISL